MRVSYQTRGRLCKDRVKGHTKVLSLSNCNDKVAINGGRQDYREGIRIPLSILFRLRKIDNLLGMIRQCKCYPGTGASLRL